MKTIKMNLNELKHPEKNVRKHPKKQIQELQRSIKMFGQIRPIIVDENNIILAGNGLAQALREMGETQAKVLKMSNLSEKDKIKLMVADNRTYSLGFDDHDNIFELLSQLDGDFDVPGYDEELLEELLAEDEEVEENLQSYGVLNKEEIQQFEGKTEEIQKKAETEPFVDKEEYEEELQKAEEGTLKEPEGHSNEYLERKPCPRCGGTGWL